MWPTKGLTNSSDNQKSATSSVLPHTCCGVAVNAYPWIGAEAACYYRTAITKEEDCADATSFPTVKTSS